MELTKEQMAELDEKYNQERYFTVFTCKTCGAELKGMIACGNHASKEHHYEFNKKGTELCLGIV